MFENSMVELEQTIKNVYFLGIGGIGMSALARYFKAKGYKVAGYDRTLSALTQKMQAEEEIRINYIDEEYLNRLNAEQETDFLRVVRFERPVIVKINGKKSIGIVIKPDAGNVKEK